MFSEKKIVLKDEINEKEILASEQIDGVAGGFGEDRVRPAGRPYEAARPVERPYEEAIAKRPQEGFILDSLRPDETDLRPDERPDKF